MNRGPIIKRYAQSYFELGKDKSLLDTFYNDANLLLRTCNESEDFCSFLNSPVIKPSKKKKVVREALEKRLNPYTLSFIDLIIDRNREPHLKNIILFFSELYKQHKGIKSVLLITALPLEKAYIDQLIPFLEKELEAPVEMDARVNRDLIGGFILKVNGKLLDSSIKHQLKEIQKQILS